MSTRAAHFSALALLFAVFSFFFPGCAGAVRPVQPAPVASRTATQPAMDEELGRIRVAVQDALVAAPPRGYTAMPKGVRLTSIFRAQDGAIVLDFSSELLEGGTGQPLEDRVHQLLTAASSVRSAALTGPHRYKVLINGIPLESYVR